MFGNAKLVMRGGVGIFYDLKMARQLQFGGEPPFGYIANNFPERHYPGPQRIRSRSIYFLGLTNPSLTPITDVPSPAISYAYITGPHFRTPYSENFNYGFQWQAAKNTMVEAVYVGSLGRID